LSTLLLQVVAVALGLLPVVVLAGFVPEQDCL
jgi:hypothetical protein